MYYCVKSVKQLFCSRRFIWTALFYRTSYFARQLFGFQFYYIHKKIWYLNFSIFIYKPFAELFIVAPDVNQKFMHIISWITAIGKMTFNVVVTIYFRSQSESFQFLYALRTLQEVFLTSSISTRGVISVLARRGWSRYWHKSWW